MTLIPPLTDETLLPMLNETMHVLNEMRDHTMKMLKVVEDTKRDQKFVDHLQRVVEHMKPLGATLTIEPDGRLTIQVLDAESEPFCQMLASYSSWYDILKVQPDRWPSHARLVRKWEVARPTPRAGDYRDKNTWSYPGKLIPTLWNGRTAHNMDGEGS
jgi:hypothetical protein